MGIEVVVETCAGRAAQVMPVKIRGGGVNQLNGANGRAGPGVDSAGRDAGLAAFSAARSRSIHLPLDASINWTLALSSSSMYLLRFSSSSLKPSPRIRAAMSATEIG